MTIKEASSLYGVSTQAIYQRIAKAGKKARDLTEGKTAELTPDGAELLESWFATDQQPEQEKPCENCKALEREIAALQTLVTALQDQLATAQADKERLYTLLSQAQQTQALALARLPAENQSLWQRMRNRLTAKRDGN